MHSLLVATRSAYEKKMNSVTRLQGLCERRSSETLPVVHPKLCRYTCLKSDMLFGICTMHLYILGNYSFWQKLSAYTTSCQWSCAARHRTGFASSSNTTLCQFLIRKKKCRLQMSVQSRCWLFMRIYREGDQAMQFLTEQISRDL